MNNSYEKSETINNNDANNQSKISTYSISYRSKQNNEKRLICYSIINNEKCTYGKTCTYAHSMEEQIIDTDRKYIYQIMLDKNLMSFYSLSSDKIDDIYRQLLFFTHVCNRCLKNKCTGGFNCRNGACDISLKLCKNDLLTGECLNRIVEIETKEFIVKKMDSSNFEPVLKYYGCINGHHLTQRNLLPYHKFIRQRDHNRKKYHQSIRHIDPMTKFFERDQIYSKFDTNITNDSDSSTDEEINGWFMDNSSSEQD